MSVPDENYGDASFEAIEAAVLKSPKGRWFLEEYARRLRSNETVSILEAIKRLERAIAPVESQPALKPSQLKYFRQDEEIFVEPKMQAPALSVVEKSETKPTVSETRGANLKIERVAVPQSEVGPAEPAPMETAETKQRVVIIRKPAGEDLSIPLLDQQSA
jgi:chaperonin GroEL (HSP60 family)